MAIEKRKAIKLTAIVLVVLTIFAAIFAAIYFGKQDAPVADKTLNVETENGFDNTKTYAMPKTMAFTAKSLAAARGEGVNALYIALDDIARLRSFRFGRESELLGPIGIAVTQIEAGTQHNVVPDTCRFVVDVRTTDAYSNEETVGILRAALRSEAVPRSTRIRAAAVGGEHPLVKAAVAAGRETYVSPTTSDRTLMPFPALKMGPGQSSRSHTADEFVLLEEIAEGIAVYEKYIGKLAQEYGWKTLG